MKGKGEEGRRGEGKIINLGLFGKDGDGRAEKCRISFGWTGGEGSRRNYNCKETILLLSFV